MHYSINYYISNYNIDSNDINATDGRIAIVATTSINDASNMLATD